MAEIAFIIDDDAPTRFVYAHVLGSLGFQIMEAADGFEALNLLQHHVPSLILLDWLLPNHPGAEVLAAVYANPHLSAARVFVISAQNRDVPDLRPGDFFLLKPVLPQQLRELVLSLHD